MIVLTNENLIHPMIFQRIKQLFEEFNPQTETEEIALCAAASNTYVWEQGFGYLDIKKFRTMIEMESFVKFPCYTREDFTNYLIRLGESTSKAKEISKCIRKGYLVKQPERMKEYIIPKEILEIAEKYCYVTSR